MILLGMFNLGIWELLILFIFGCGGMALIATVIVLAYLAGKSHGMKAGIQQHTRPGDPPDRTRTP